MIVYTEVRYDTYVGFISSIHTEQMPYSNIKFTFDDDGKLIDAEFIKENIDSYLDHEKHVNTWYNYRNKIRELTDVELSLLAEKYTGADGLDVVDYGRAIMQAYREKLNETSHPSPV